MPIATRSLPVGAISSFRPSAFAGGAIMIEIPRTKPAMRGKDLLNIQISPPVGSLLSSPHRSLWLIEGSVETPIPGRTTEFVRPEHRNKQNLHCVWCAAVFRFFGSLHPVTGHFLGHVLDCF